MKLTYRDAESMGRARKRRARPNRPTWLVVQALDKLHFRYFREVWFWSPEWTGKRGDRQGAPQWCDFVVYWKDDDGNRHPLYILLDQPSKRWQEQEKRAWEIKQKALEKKGPVLVLKTGYRVQEYEIFIRRKIQKLQQERRTKELGYE